MSLFQEEILNGLQQNPKTLPSKYFYDQQGDILFQQIMQMKTYYLPGCEREIITKQSAAIATQLKTKHLHWNVVELGAGDGTKTAVFLKKLVENGLDIHYIALDISPHILIENKKNVQKALPAMPIKTVAGNYFKTCHEVLQQHENNLVLFLGSNIGNYNETRTHEFLQWLKKGMRAGDKAIIAFDLKKNPKTILAAYNDPEGITNAFNLNLLHRINRELHANFEVAAFDHYPYYNPINGNCFSYLVSLKEQNVTIDGVTILFAKNEVIHTEVSKKYDIPEIENLSKTNGFSILKHYVDSKSYYTLSLLEG